MATVSGTADRAPLQKQMSAGASASPKAPMEKQLSASSASSSPGSGAKAPGSPLIGSKPPLDKQPSGSPILSTKPPMAAMAAASSAQDTLSPLPGDKKDGKSPSPPSSPGSGTRPVSDVARRLSMNVAANKVMCTVCKEQVFKMDELVVDKAVMHKKCFVCSHCKRQLSLGNFTLANNLLFCKAHYMELFKNSGGKYEQAFGDAGFEKKAERSYTPPPSKPASPPERRSSSATSSPTLTARQAASSSVGDASPPQDTRSPMAKAAALSKPA